MICAACGAVSEPGARLCRACGAALEAPAPATPPPLPPPFPEVPRPAPVSVSGFGLPSGNDPGLLADARSLGWNWGGFLLPYWWLLGHGQPGIGFLLLVSAYIPIVNGIHVLLYPLTGIYLGLNGYELAWKHSPYHSVAQLKDRERVWSWWGLAGVIVFMVFVLTVLMFWATLAALLREAVQDLPG